MDRFKIIKHSYRGVARAWSLSLGQGVKIFFLIICVAKTSKNRLLNHLESGWGQPRIDLSPTEKWAQNHR